MHYIKQRLNGEKMKKIMIEPNSTTRRRNISASLLEQVLKDYKERLDHEAENIRKDNGRG